MSVVLVTTPGAANANSYATAAEAGDYFKARLPLSTPWANVPDKTAALAMATRVLEAFLRPQRVYVPDKDHFVTRRTWTGQPATTTQRLSWPRIGMYDRNGNAIPSDVIPQELKEAQAELAGQLAIKDTTLDNAVKAAGIRSVSAGSVSVSFKDSIELHVLPDSIWFLLPDSWLTDEIITPARPALFDVVS